MFQKHVPTGRSPLSKRSAATLALAMAIPLFAGCLGDSGGDSAASAVANGAPPENTPPQDRFSDGRVFRVDPGESATSDMVGAMIQLRPGDTR
ncbi:MAG: hypothetical protein EP328_05795 [Gammaproteobacteria bacterium]|nr:MAG: hypothetical protein EP328_05795 [Gammaproteobacteria bacterium]